MITEGRAHGSSGYPSDSRRSLSIDLMRATAAFGVYIFHASLAAGFDKFRLDISFPWLERKLSVPNFLSMGAMGVSLFFIVSGYCLTQSRIFGQASRSGLAGYYESRFDRIYPTYMFSLLATLLAWWMFEGTHALFVPEIGRPALLPDFGIHALFLQGFSTDSFLSFNGTLWSMATEVQFYMVFPLLFLLFSKIRPHVLLLTILFACICVRFLAESSAGLSAPVPGGVSRSVLISYSLMGRLFEFVFGMWIAVQHAKRGLPQVGLWYVPGFLAGAAFATLKLPGWIVEPAWGLAFGTALIWAIQTVDPEAERLCENSRTARAIRTFGIHSYSFFLIHWVVLFVSGRIGWIDAASPWVRFFLEGIVCFFLALFVAKWMYKSVENRRALRFRRIFRIGQPGMVE